MGGGRQERLPGGGGWMGNDGSLPENRSPAIVKAPTGSRAESHPHVARGFIWRLLKAKVLPLRSFLYRICTKSLSQDFFVGFERKKFVFIRARTEFQH